MSLYPRSGRERPRRERSESIVEGRVFIRASKGFVGWEGEAIPAQARWKNYLGIKKVEVTEVSLAVFVFVFFAGRGSTFFFFLDIKNRVTRQESHQGSPRHHLLNWSKRGISPNANEQRTIHVTQNIRYALMRQGVRQGGDL